MNKIKTDTISAALQYPGSISLVFASHKRPGGAWENHEKGQEEWIARRSNLVERLDPYLNLYGDNRNPFYIILKDLKVKTDKVKAKRDFIVSPAPVARLYDNPNEVLEERIKEICKQVADWPTFITGAFGAGFFGCDRQKVWDFFEEYATNETVIWACI